MREVLNGRGASAEHLSQFRPQTTIDLRMFGQNIPRPGQGIGGRLMPRSNEGSHFVTEFLVTQPVARRLVESQE